MFIFGVRGRISCRDIGGYRGLIYLIDSVYFTADRSLMCFCAGWGHRNLTS
jgi:hypothetical protein